MRKRSVLTLGLGIALAGSLGALRSRAAEPEQNGCVYNRQIYVQGDEVCQNDTRKRCENGAWVDVGHCKDRPLQQPRADGGDAVAPPQMPPPPPVPQPRQR
jgi:hypothetical protein